MVRGTFDGFYACLPISMYLIIENTFAILMKFLDANGVGTLWNAIKEKYVDWDNMVIEEELTVSSATSVINICAASPKGTLQLVPIADATTGMYELGFLNGVNFHNICACPTPDNMVAIMWLNCLSRTSRGTYVFKHCIIKNTLDGKFYAPNRGGTAVIQFDKLIDAIEYLIVNDGIESITSDELDEVLV